MKFLIRRTINCLSLQEGLSWLSGLAGALNGPSSDAREFSAVTLSAGHSK